jgi:hypothetical protein
MNTNSRSSEVPFDHHAPHLDGLQRDGDEIKPMRKIEFVDQEQATFNSMQREVFRARVYRLILCAGGSL